MRAGWSLSVLYGMTYVFVELGKLIELEVAVRDQAHSEIRASIRCLGSREYTKLR